MPNPTEQVEWWQAWRYTKKLIRNRPYVEYSSTLNKPAGPPRTSREQAESDVAYLNCVRPDGEDGEIEYQALQIWPVVPFPYKYA